MTKTGRPLLLAVTLSGFFMSGCSGASSTPEADPGSKDDGLTSATDSSDANDSRNASDANDGSIVRTASGRVKGLVQDGYRSFQGIPFAAPPVGERRWQAPAPVAPWDEVKDATKPSPTCSQGGGGRPFSGAEDCLYLNVTTPARSPKLKPVMVWLHGGSFVTGDGSRYQPPRLAVAGDVVVVTVNYRLGVFGFFAHPSLGDSNFGFQDQQAALRWVKQNAMAFGGDPTNVTLFGESAGGQSTCAQLTAPSAAGLFQRAAMTSGTCTIDWPNQGLDPDQGEGSGWRPLSRQKEVGNSVATGLGCTNAETALDCLRAIPASEVLMSGPVQSAPAFNFREPSYETPLLPKHPAALLAEGRFHRVPILLGSNLDEGRYFTFKFHLVAPITAERYQDLLQVAYGAHAAAVAEHYPLRAYDSPGLAWGAVITDRVLACPTFRADQILARSTPVYAFEFADRQAPPILPVPPGMPPGATHGSELLFLFDMKPLDPPFTAEQRELSNQMMKYWARFGKTGNPNASGLPEWSRFRANAGAPYVQSLAPGAGGIHPVDFAALHQCDFWSSLK